MPSLTYSTDRAAYAAAAHPPGSRGAVVVMRRNRHSTAIPVEAVPTSRALHHPDAVYQSMARYKHAKRGVSGRAVASRTRDDVVGVRVFKLDLDYHREFEEAGFSPASYRAAAAGRAALWMEDTGRIDVDLPYPSRMVFSGRGLVAEYDFTADVPRAALARYEALAKAFVGEARRPDSRRGPADVETARALLERRYAVVSPYRPDMRATDVTRVHRIPGTVHEVSGETVEVLVETGAVYEFDAFCSQVLPYTRERARELREEVRARSVESRERRTHDRPPTIRLTHTTRWQTVVSDLRKWAAGCAGGVPPKGYRRVWAMLMVNAMAQAGDDDVNTLADRIAPEAGVAKSRHARDSASAVRKRHAEEQAGLTRPWNNTQVSPMYGYGGATMAELLGVDAEIARRLDLRLICPDQVKKERRATAAREDRAAKGATPRARSATQRQEVGRDGIRMKKEGVPVIEAARRLGVSRSQLYEAMKEVTPKAAGAAPIVTAEEDLADCPRFVTVSVWAESPEGVQGRSAAPRMGLAALLPRPDVVDDDADFALWWPKPAADEPPPRPIPPVRYLDTDIVVPDPPPRRWVKRSPSRVGHEVRAAARRQRRDLVGAFLMAGYDLEDAERHVRDGERETRLQAMRDGIGYVPRRFT